MKRASMLVMIVTLAGCASSRPMPQIIAHRGASDDAPENTLAAMKLGWEQGADADELDVHLSKDGRIVVIHDATTKRTAGLDKPVVEQTADELRALDAGKWKSPKYAGEKIPLLEEVIPTIPPGKRLLIEIKCGAEIIPELRRVLESSGKPPAQLAIITFKLEVAQQVKQAMLAHTVYWIHAYSADKQSGQFPRIADLIDRARQAKLDGLDLEQKFPIDQTMVRQVHMAGLELYTWTVDDPQVAHRHRLAGVDGITTNRPGAIRRELELRR